jgi:hypothetical protein
MIVSPRGMPPSQCLPCVGGFRRVRFTSDARGPFASSGLLPGVGGAGRGAVAHHQGSFGCVRIFAEVREGDGGSATTKRRVPRPSVGGAVGCGAAPPARGEVPAGLSVLAPGWASPSQEADVNVLAQGKNTY